MSTISPAPGLPSRDPRSFWSQLRARAAHIGTGVEWLRSNVGDARAQARAYLGKKWSELWSCTGTQFLRPVGHLIAYYPLLLPIPLLLYAVCWNLILAEYDAFHVLWSSNPIAGFLSGVGVAVLLGGTLLAVFLLNQVSGTPPPPVSERTPVDPPAAPERTDQRPVAPASSAPSEGKVETTGAPTLLAPPEPKGPATSPPKAHEIEPVGRLAYWALWGVSLVLIALPAIAPCPFFDGAPAPFRVNESTATDGLPVFAEAGRPQPHEDTAAFENTHRQMKGARWWFPLGLLVTALVFGLTRLLLARFLWEDAARLRGFAFWLFAVFSSHYIFMFLAHWLLGHRSPDDTWENRDVVRPALRGAALTLAAVFLLALIWRVVIRRIRARENDPNLRLAAFLSVGLVTVLVLIGSFRVTVHGTAYCGAAGAPVALLGVLGVLGGLLTLITSWNYPRRPWVIVATVGPLTVPFFFSALQTEYRVPGLEDYYTENKLVALEDYEKLRPHDRLGGNPVAARERERERDIRAEAADGLVTDATALAAARQRIGPDRPMIVVAVSGGASASAVYTADILYTLEMQYPGFIDQVRMITGASGGMLGAAYFVAEFRSGTPLAVARDKYRADPSKTEDYRRTVAEARKKALEDLSRDFLGPLVQRWIYRDVPLYLLPRATTNDRGLALEQAWRTMRGSGGPATAAGVLHVPFTDLRADERAGKIPSLIFTPMMLEDGRQLLISNLNLNYMVDSAILDNECGCGKEDGPPMSHTALEFYRLFPDAGPTFRLSTAVRLNASFPFFSPAAALPTKPRRHVVDAGYFDNYGTLAATKWIYRNAALVHRGPRRKPEPGARAEVVMLQIHCFSFESETKEWVRKEEKGMGVAKPAALHTLVAPLAGALASRRANMIYRGDERVDAVNQLLEKSELPRFERVLIECEIGPSLNWALTPDAIRLLRRDVWAQLEDPDQKRTVKGLDELLKNGTRPAPAPRVGPHR